MKNRKISRYIHKAPIRVLKIKRLSYRLKIKRMMIQLNIALAQEKKETKEMIAIYQKYTRGNATKAEMRLANDQFIDILKGLGLGVFALLPFAPITIPLIIKLGKLVGVDVMPDMFNKKSKFK
ncbi:hypothetical protein [Psychromonas algicola]|uniref:hypothetical protein n=1 Tax=Psychromonas algicola TaxID=2555642 RepID=UPI0010686377|nr:hypothetical protein [Psychromonas sp. RZ5]TEW52897.1 hypothetical protein E2R67_00390 [Psychromonas sp. RZ5]